MRPRLRRTLWCTGIFGVVAIALLLAKPLHRGWQLRERLMTAAEQAKTITVFEHTDRFDPNIDREAPYKEKVFRTVMLSPQERSRLSAAFPPSLDYSDLIHLRCLFQSHHRIEMVAQDGRATVLKICFHCQQLVIGEEHPRLFPMGWDGSLEQFIRSLGMSRLPKESNAEGSAAPQRAAGPR